MFFILDAYKNLLNDLRRDSLMMPKAGSHYLSEIGYEKICIHLFKLQPRDQRQLWSTSLFGWTFFVLIWNLMSRPEAVESIQMSHITWKTDCIAIDENGGKADRGGDNSYYKRIYANPLKPATCPILAIATLIFCSGSRDIGSVCLFTGNNPKGRFADILRQVADENVTEDELREMGCHRHDISPYSARKGSRTYAGGQVTGPPESALELRMGHTLGGARDPYIHPTDGADGHCGRTVALLPLLENNFAILPPHFDKTTSASLTCAFWNAVVPGYERLPQSFKSCLPFLLATLMYHEDYLRENLHSSHPLWMSRVFTHNPILSDLKSKVVTSILRDGDIVASGVPPHILHNIRFDVLEQEFKRLKEKFGDELGKIRQELSVLPNVIADVVVKEMRKNFTINGVTPLTLRDLDEFKLNLMTEMRQMFLEPGRTNQENQTENDGTIDNGIITGGVQTWWKTFNWNDGNPWRLVPYNYRFPRKIAMKVLWDLWWLGDQSTGIRPIRLLDGLKSLPYKGDKKLYCQAKNVCIYLEKIILNKQGLLPEGVRSVRLLSIDQHDIAFAAAYKYAFDLISPHLESVKRTIGRKEDFSYVSFYDLITQCKENRKKRISKKQRTI